jgi:hypothetical protein
MSLCLYGHKKAIVCDVLLQAQLLVVRLVID